MAAFIYFLAKPRTPRVLRTLLGRRGRARGTAGVRFSGPGLMAGPSFEILSMNPNELPSVDV